MAEFFVLRFLSYYDRQRQIKLMKSFQALTKELNGKPRTRARSLD